MTIRFPIPVVHGEMMGKNGMSIGERAYDRVCRTYLSFSRRCETGKQA